MILLFKRSLLFTAILLTCLGLNPAIAQEKHTVKAKETLYSIAKKYSITVDDLKKWNRLKNNNLAVGQVLLITNPFSKRKDRLNASSNYKPVTHTVKKGETLFSISKEYDVSVADIKTLNSLKKNSLSVGQELIVKLLPITDQLITTNTTPESLKLEVFETVTLATDTKFSAFVANYSISSDDFLVLNPFLKKDQLLKKGLQVTVIKPPRIINSNPYKVEGLQNENTSTVSSSVRIPVFEYDKREESNSTTNGELINLSEFTIAHPNLPFGSKVLLRNTANNHTCVARVNDRTTENAIKITEAIKLALNFDVQNSHIVVITTL